MTNDVKNILDLNKEKMVMPDGIAVVGRDFGIIAFNEAASRITGYFENEIINSNFEILFKISSNQSKYIIDSLEKGKSFLNQSVIITCKDGSEKNVLASITPVSKPDGKIISVVFVFRDTQEMLSLVESLETTTLELYNERNKLNAIFNSNIEGTFTIDAEWNITSFNSSAENITGHSKDSAIGKKCWEVFGSNLCRNGCHMEKTMSENVPTVGNELVIINKSGKETPIRVNSAPLLNNKGEKIGAVETFIDISELKNLSEHLTDKFQFSNVIGKGKRMQKIFTLLENVSKTDSTILITGESGSGKEVAARAIHLNSGRGSKPFVAVNCSAFAESLIESELFGHEKGAFTGAIKTKIGKFEIANEGTLFLDEIGDISPQVQTKLLRVIETKKLERVGGNKTIGFDVRLIAATNKDLHKEIKEGRFREDLFYRINVINIHIPPLRDRMEDFPLLINYFLEKFNAKFNRKIKNISSGAYNKLLNYNFPGNIRELENIIEHAFVLCGGDEIAVDHLPDKFSNATEKPMESKGENPLFSAEKSAIVETLQKHNGNRTKTAIELGVDKSTLWRKMKKYGLT